MRSLLGGILTFNEFWLINRKFFLSVLGFWTGIFKLLSVSDLSMRNLQK